MIDLYKMNITEYAIAFYVRYYDEDEMAWETIKANEENQNKDDEGDRLFKGISPTASGFQTEYLPYSSILKNDEI